MEGLPRFATYKPVRFLGQGASARTYLSKHTWTHQYCVLKVFDASDSARSQFLTELQILSDLTHPNLVRLLDFGHTLDTDQDFLVLEYSGGDDFVSASRRVTSHDFYSMVAQLLRGLDYLHIHGRVHGDLKPSNIVVDSTMSTSAPAPRVRILDFGLSHSLPREAPAIAGSIHYIAPEVLRGVGATSSSDLYSFGAILYECLAGVPPFSRSTINELVQAHINETPDPLPERISPELHPLIGRLLSKDPLERPGSAAELLSRLSELVPSILLPLQYSISRSDLLAHPPLVGRQVEVQEAFDQIRSCLLAEGGSRWMLIALCGAIGSGKTRLLRALGVRARVLGFRVLNLNGDQNYPQSDQGSGAFRDWIAGQRGQPLLVTFDNAGASHDIAQALVPLFRQRPSYPLVLVVAVSTQSSWKESLKKWEQLLPDGMRLVSVRIGPLAVGEVGNLIGQALGVAAVESSISEAFHDVSGGNPLLLTRALAASLDHGNLRLDGRKLFLDRSPETALSPEALIAPLCPTIDLLRPDQHLALTFIATAQCPLSLDLLASITQNSMQNVSAELDRLVDQGLVRVNPDGYSASSSLLAIALVQRRSTAEMKEIRLQLGALLSVSGSLPHLEEAAHQFALAQDRSRAIEAARRAASVAAEHLNRQSEVRSYRLILEHCEPDAQLRADTFFRLCLALRRSGQSSDALRALEDALTNPNLTHRQRLGLLLERAHSARDIGNFRLSADSARLAMRIAQELGEPMEVLNAQIILGTAFCFLSRSAAGRRLLNRAAGRARTLKEKRLLASAFYALGASRWQEGDYILALSYERRRYALLLAAGDPRDVALSLENIAILLSDRGYFSKAKDYHTKALDLMKRISLIGPQVGCLVNLADTLRGQGDLREAFSYSIEALDPSRGSNPGHVRLTAKANISAVSSTLGYHTEAIGHLRGLLAQSRVTGTTVQGVAILVSWAIVLHHLGRFEASRRVAVRAGRLAQASQSWQTMLEVRMLEAAALAEIGRLKDAAGILSEALTGYETKSPFDVRIRARLLAARIDLECGASFAAVEAQVAALIATARRKKMRWHLATGLLIRGEALLAASRAEEAVRDLEEAVASATKHGDRSLFWQAAHLLGRAYEQMLRYERALGYTRMAANTVRELGMNLEEERYRQSFQGQARVRAVLESHERLRRAVGRKAKYDLAALNRNEQISRRMLGALSAIGQRLASILDLDELMASVLDLAIENVRAERGIIFLLDPVTGEMRPGCARGMDRASLAEVTSYSRSVLQRAAQGQTILTVDVGKDPTLSGYQSLILHEIKSILCVPMRARGKVTGVIYLDTRRGPQLFTDKERAFVDSFASQAAIGLENARLFGDMSAENARLRRQAEERAGFASLIGTSPVMLRLAEMLRGVVDSECSVLICGESGTGKEVVARAIHFNGARRNRKFVAIDCGALPENLLEAELFGYARGAFTGAERDRVGLIESASGGTLFLDEVTNTTPALQAKLLRVIQEREIRRLGENSVRRVDLRIVAATNADIKAMVHAGRFRQDLYYRLNVVTVEVPPLRERPEDVPLLAAHFLQVRARDGAAAKRLGPGVAAILSRYNWPGNVRELENLVERLVALVPSRVISVDDLPEPIRPRAGTGGSSPASGSPGKSGEQMMIEDALRRCAGDKAKAARYIGWHRQKLYRRMRELGIPIDFGQAA